MKFSLKSNYCNMPIIC